LSLTQALSPKELKAYQLYAQSGNSREVAKHMRISFRTVEDYLLRVKKKMCASDTLEVLEKLIENRLIFVKELEIDIELTPKEMLVLKELKHYKTREEIGSSLQISHRTVGEHINNILIKSGCNNKYQLFSQLLMYPEKFQLLKTKNHKYKQIIKLATDGLSNQQIASRVGTSDMYVSQVKLIVKMLKQGLSCEAIASCLNKSIAYISNIKKVMDCHSSTGKQLSSF
jgi:DNA-binding CsgD family transcriptional regulator